MTLSEGTSTDISMRICYCQTLRMRARLKPTWEIPGGFLLSRCVLPTSCLIYRLSVIAISMVLTIVVFLSLQSVSFSLLPPSELCML